MGRGKARDCGVKHMQLEIRNKLTYLYEWILQQIIVFFLK